MNELAPPPDNGVPVHEHPLDHQSVQTSTQSKGKAGRTILAFLVIALLAGALGYGFWKHYTLHAEVMATAEARHDFVPSVRTAVWGTDGSDCSPSAILAVTNIPGRRSCPVLTTTASTTASRVARRTDGPR